MKMSIQLSYTNVLYKIVFWHDVGEDNTFHHKWNITTRTHFCNSSSTFVEPLNSKPQSWTTEKFRRSHTVILLCRDARHSNGLDWHQADGEPCCFSAIKTPEQTSFYFCSLTIVSVLQLLGRRIKPKYVFYEYTSFFPTNQKQKSV